MVNYANIYSERVPEYKCSPEKMHNKYMFKPSIKTSFVRL